MKVSDYIIEFLVKEKVTHIFEFIGGAITHLIDSTSNREDIHCVSVHHEQAAAFAAEAYSRTKGNLGVAMATSGPGALNMITGIGSCYFDSVPCLFITGQVNTYEYKFDRPVRQIGFQETDIVSVAKPLTKYAEMVLDPQKIRYHLEKAIYLAKSGRPGPVLLDIPMNIQRAQIEPKQLESYYDSIEFKSFNKASQCGESDIEEVIKLIKEAKRPLVLVGGGIRTAQATNELLTFIRGTNIPVVTSLMGLDALDHENKQFFGMIGSYGNRYSNLTLANCDLLLILGSRLDTRQTGTRPDSFARGAKKVHVDIDENELNAKLKADISINCDVKQFLILLNSQLKAVKTQDLASWYNIIEGYKERFPTTPKNIDKDENINPNYFIKLVSSYCSEGDIVCLDVGQHQMWAAQSFGLKENQRMIISGGLGAMGFALPAALGAAIAAPGNNVVVIAGDGGIQLNIQELDLVARQQLPIKIFVMNNGCLGMVRQFQEMYFEGRTQSTVKGYSCPDFVRLAAAYGIPSYNINSYENAEDVINSALSLEGPALVNVNLELQTNVNPKLIVNRPIEDMSPVLDREELEKLMIIGLAEEMDVPK